MLLVPPAMAVAHSGSVSPPTGFALSDLAMFAALGLGIFLARRAVRARMRKRD